MTVYGVQAIITILTHFRASDYTLLAGTVIWLYDILLTLDDEMTLLWTKGGGLIKALYLIVGYGVKSTFIPDNNTSQQNRYLPAVGLPLIISRECAIGLAIVTLCQAIGTIVATTIFIARLYTVFCLNRNIRIFLVLALVISHICIMTFTIILIEGCTMSYSDVLRICITNFPKTTGAVYITPIFIESAIAFATLYHAYASQYSSTKRQRSVKKILRTLHVDGFLYSYHPLCSSRTLHITQQVWVAPGSLIFLLCYFEYAFSSAITSRWFLSFRKVLAESFVSATFPTTMLTTGGKTMSVGAGLELAHRGLSHSATLSVAQDPTKPDTYSETRERR
ncbi:hypothetical protein CPB86DRAFT_713634 [Serendipita vermifera]|nr:hypothetical protein CPB86DRAFT_713634 [Serendipita vermifera]